MLIGMKSLNEERMIQPVIGDIHDEPWVDRIIVIDGWSTDNTVVELRQFPKVEVYQHKWEKWYHNQEVSQSNILMSYIPNGQTYFILDFDEKCSLDLKEALAKIDKEGAPADCVSVSRQSFELMRYDDDSPFAIPDGDGFWETSHQIGQYPDFQLRVITKKVGMHWINSPHHMLFGVGTQWSHATIQADLIHYHGKEDARDRESIEKQWLRHQARRNQLGLTCDVFEGDIKPELAKYADSEYWGD